MKQKIETMKPVMSRDVAEHFIEWLEKYVAIEDQHEVEQHIMSALRNEPDLIERGFSWEQIANRNL